MPPTPGANPAAEGPRGQVVAVIGSGFSGLLTAIRLLEAQPPLTVRLVEKAPRFGRGRAYAPASPDHLLNVRAANMSAFPDRPRHFQDWLRRHGAEAGPDAFATRRRYGDYLQGLLRGAVRRDGAAGRLLLEKDEAVDLEPAPGGWRVSLALGRSFPAHAVVLALGAGSPERLAGVDPDVLSRRTYVADPWASDLSALPDGRILLLGAGLTMVDVALSLDRPGRELIALSRHGLLPRPHAAQVLPAPPPDGPLDTPRRALRALRGHARAVGWRSAVDSLRPLTPAVWASWNAAERRRFLRHVQPWWDVHRHRIAPEVATRLAQPMWGERLAVLAGRLESLTTVEGGFGAAIRLRGRRLAVNRRFDAVVNCTGLSADLRAFPLLQALQARGLARPDPLRLGLDLTDDFRLIGADGRPVRDLYAVGPLARAAQWETLAVPDLRTHADRLARTLAASLTCGR